MIRHTAHDMERQRWAITALVGLWTDYTYEVGWHEYPALHPVDYYTTREGRVTGFVEVKGCNKEPSAALPLFISETKATALSAHVNTAPDSVAWVVWAFRDHARYLPLWRIQEQGTYTRYGRNDRGYDEYEYGWTVPYVATVAAPYA